MSNFTNECLEDLKKTEGAEKASVKELRTLACSFCKNPTCMEAAGLSNGDPFTHRVNTQVDRLFNTPIVVQSEVSKYRSLPDFDTLENFENWGPNLIMPKKFQKTAPLVVEPDVHHASTPPIKGFPRKSNTAVPKGGFILGGDIVQDKKEVPVDPWEHPSHKVKAGAKVKFDDKGNVKK